MTLKKKVLASKIALVLLGVAPHTWAQEAAPVAAQDAYSDENLVMEEVILKVQRSQCGALVQNSIW